MPTITTRNPATGEALEIIERMTAAEIDRRLSAAAVAAERWRDAQFDERAAFLHRVASRLRDERERLARTAAREMGKPVEQALAEVEKCAGCCEYFAEHGPAMLAERAWASSAKQSAVAFRALGVVFAIMPWNFPYWQVIRAAVPALLAGNAVVLKHADSTTRCALELERLFAGAGSPNLFQTLLVSNEGADGLIADPRIAAVTLTGSERAGVAVAAAAGAALKKCVLELGGSDAFVVLDDADIARSVEVAVKSRFQNAGQSCIAAKRFIVDRSVYDTWTERFVAAVGKLRVGDPMRKDTDVGPLVHAAAVTTIHEQVTATVAAGAALLAGGEPVRHDDGETGLEARGSYYLPTVVANVQPGMRMFDEETFGPAAAIVRAADEADALRLANATSFGLGGSVWTRDIKRARRFAARLEAGSAFINSMVVSDPHLPFGGVKRSGYGRELSAFGLHEFVNIQTIALG